MRPPLLLVALFAVPGLGACDVVFGTELPAELELDADAQPDGNADYDRCAAAIDPEPLRYQVLRNPNTRDEIVDGEPTTVAAPWPWEQARADCQRHGLDLMVLNDANELGQTVEEVPAWIGQKHIAGTWQAVDDCEPYTGDAEVEPGRECGVITGSLTLSTAGCTEATVPVPPEEAEDAPPRLVSVAICELPRPRTAACLPNDPDATTYTASTAPMSRDAAIAYCDDRDATLAEIGSHAEWLRVAALVREAPRRYWTATTFDGTAWQTASTCPMLYAWTGGTVGAIAPGACAATDLEEDTGGELHMHGLTATACSADAIYALCEQ